MPGDLLVLLKELRKALHLALSLPKTIVFNVAYFGLSGALRLPVIVSYKVELARLAGVVKLRRLGFAAVRLGFPTNEVFSGAGSSAVWNVGGRVTFGEHVRLGPGFRIICTGELQFGDNVDVNANCSIFCKDCVAVGSGALWAWGITVMDHDFHALRDDAGGVLNEPRAVRLGERVWLGCNAHLLKGTRLAAGTVVGAGAVVHGEFDEPHCVIAGNPSRVVKRGVNWANDA